MPAYDYMCNACQEIFDVTHPMGAHPVVDCPVCGGPARKVIIAYPHTMLNWKAHDRNDTGSDRMVIRSARRGKKNQPMDDRATSYRGVRLSGEPAPEARQ